MILSSVILQHLINRKDYTMLDATVSGEEHDLTPLETETLRETWHTEQRIQFYFNRTT